ncbi:RDD family protein [Flavobacteriaceae bacterium F08102]|nr:RDD family protein [Flavobacteriaceae bacterium F08102]
MDNFQIETAQNVNIHQNAAHLTTRIGSFLLDLILIAVYSGLIIWIMNALNYPPSLDSVVVYTLLGLPVFLYSLLFEVLCNGQTPGKMANQIRVVKLDGSKPTFSNYLLRWLLRFIDIDLAGGSVAILTILLNGKGQRLGDIAGETTVISERKELRIENTIMADLPSDYQPTFPQVTVLNDKDIQTIKALYQKSIKTRNPLVLEKLANKIKELTGIHSNLRSRDFIKIIIDDYVYYTQQ